MNILLVCACGLSTSLLAQKLEKEMHSQGKAGRVWATDLDSVNNVL